MSQSDYDALKQKYRQIIVPCEVCGSEDTSSFQEYGRVAEPGEYGRLSVRICKRCGFKMQNPRYEDAFYQEYYDLMYREVAFGSLKPSELYVEQQKKRGKGVLGYVRQNGVMPGHMLDHGCASGATMLAWIEAGWNARGIDPHRPSVEGGRELDLQIDVASGESLPHEDGTFDLVLSLGSLEHCYDLARSMSEIRRVTAPGGRLVVRWRSDVIFGSPLEYYNHNHYRFFTDASWQLVLASHGYKIVASTTDKLEGWDSYAYFIAVRENEVVPDRVTEMIASGVRGDWAAELKKLETLREDYARRCEFFLDLYEAHSGDASELVAQLRQDARGFSWGFLGGPAKDVVERSAMEAYRYMSEYRAGRVQ